MHINDVRAREGEAAFRAAANVAYKGLLLWWCAITSKTAMVIDFRDDVV